MVASLELRQGLCSADFVVFRTATESEMLGCKSRKNECHQNAQRFVALHPEYTLVNGWLQQSHMIFVKHSVVRSPSGELICVTLDKEDRYRFTVHLDEWDRQPFDLLDSQVFGFPG